MGNVVVHRPARHELPDPGDEPVVIAAPPPLAEAPTAAMSAAMIIMPLVSGAGSLLITLTNANRPLFAAAGLLFLVASVALGVVLFVSTKSGARRREREQRERYLDYLEEVRGTLRTVAAQQRRTATVRHPDPAVLLDAARLPARRWERRAGDADFLQLRVGSGVQPLARPVQPPATDALAAYDPVGLGVAEQLVARYGTLADQPYTVDLREVGTLSVVGDRATGRRLARAMVGQLVAFHSPDDVGLAVVRHPQLAAAWDWVKWLPHAMDEQRGDGPLPYRMIASSTTELADALADEMERRREELQRRRGRPPGPGTRRLAVVVDGEYQATLSGFEGAVELGVHLVVLVGARREEPSTVHQRLAVATDGTLDEVATVDDFGPGDAAALARSLCPVRLAEPDVADRLHADIGLPEILGVPDMATLDPARTWRPRPTRDLLRIPIGVGGQGTPVWLDLKESALGGMGPHGLIVGATGSGKSEMLRTLVSSLVIAHPPEELALLLVDFKGGATFADMRDLPHMAGMITNLADDLALVDRFREALTGELLRRQELLKSAGNLPNLHAYRQAGGPEPLPHLLVIIDEFSELLTAEPDFAEVFVTVGRIGRSIGVHLLLATQRLEVGKIRGLESHLSYRIGLRTFSEAESREVLGLPDAYHLPPEPGSGFLKVDTTVFERFKAAMVSQPYRPRRPSDELVPVIPYTASNGLGAFLARRPSSGSSDGPAPSELSVLQIMVDRLCTADARRVRPVWLDPLPPALPLDAVINVEPDRMLVPIGLEDAPREQQQSPLMWDFTGAEGNLVVVGGPLSGKSTLVRTLLASLTLRYPPGQVACFCVDYGGGTLTPLASLPHVGAVAGRVEPDRVRRTIEDVRAMLDRREELLRQYGFDSAAALRRARARGEIDVFGDVFLIIDGWGTLREADPDLEDTLVEIAARGPALGVHTVLTVVTPTQVRARLAAAFGGRIELRLGDPFDSAIDRRLAGDLPKDVPGRALVVSEHYAQIALPRVDGQATVDDLPSAVTSLVELVSQRWPALRVPVVQVLPALVSLSSVPLADGPGAPIGLSERDFGPAIVNLFGADPHLLVYGDAQTGKSTVLRTLMSQLVATNGPDRLGIVLLDYRRAHLGVVPEEYLLAYCTSPQQAAQAAAALASNLRERVPGPDVTPQQLRDRTWWTGLDVLVVADDYDLVASTSGNPLLPLAEYATQGRDLGLHVVLARRTGGAARVQYEPVLQAVNDMSSPGLLFSGDRLEGRLVCGVASAQLPVGRALHARRGLPAEQVQVAWTPPPA